MAHGLPKNVGRGTQAPSSRATTGTRRIIGTVSTMSPGALRRARTWISCVGPAAPEPGQGLT
jgi:hypothetical protein